MSEDIVTRLRHAGWPYDSTGIVEYGRMVKEAADEIERLREFVLTLNREASQLPGWSELVRRVTAGDGESAGDEESISL